MDEEDEHLTSGDDDGEGEDGSVGSGSGDGKAAEGTPDPLYDPELDDKDAAWVAKQRSGHASDAILSCPGCFTTLCLDCQQHEQYHNQFRAVSAYNVVVDKNQPVDPAAGGGGKGRRAKKAKASQYFKVVCAVCDTEVGAFDDDEVYHFFHVFPSNA